MPNAPREETDRLRDDHRGQAPQSPWDGPSEIRRPAHSVILEFENEPSFDAEDDDPREGRD